MPDIARIQGELKAAGVDGWLLYDFHNRDAIAYHVLGHGLRQVHQPAVVLLDPGDAASRSGSLTRSSRPSSTRCRARSASTSRGASCTPA